MPNLLSNEDELTIQVCLGDHSWSVLVILAMTMTMTINSNSVLLIRLASAGRYESFEHVQNVCVPGRAQHEYFFWKHVVIFFVAQLTCSILVILTVFVVVLTVYYVIRTDSETGADQKTMQTKTKWSWMCQRLLQSR